MPAGASPGDSQRIRRSAAAAHPGRPSQPPGSLSPSTTGSIAHPTSSANIEACTSLLLLSKTSSASVNLRRSRCTSGRSSNAASLVIRRVPRHSPILGMVKPAEPYGRYSSLLRRRSTTVRLLERLDPKHKIGFATRKVKQSWAGHEFEDDARVLALKARNNWRQDINAMPVGRAILNVAFAHAIDSVCYALDSEIADVMAMPRQTLGPDDRDRSRRRDESGRSDRSGWSPTHRTAADRAFPRRHVTRHQLPFGDQWHARLPLSRFDHHPGRQRRRRQACRAASARRVRNRGRSWHGSQCLSQLCIARI